jgi:hypothetical protein
MRLGKGQSQEMKKNGLMLKRRTSRVERKESEKKKLAAGPSHCCTK